jgi:hypothetical protein
VLNRVETWPEVVPFKRACVAQPFRAALARHGGRGGSVSVVLMRVGPHPPRAARLASLARRSRRRSRGASGMASPLAAAGPCQARAARPTRGKTNLRRRLTMRLRLGFSAGRLGIVWTVGLSVRYWRISASAERTACGPFFRAIAARWPNAAGPAMALPHAARKRCWTVLSRGSHCAAGLTWIRHYVRPVFSSVFPCGPCWTVLNRGLTRCAAPAVDPRGRPGARGSSSRPPSPPP